ncbi:hypothetical protein RE428_36100 [Marinobacter nanhaiticus D15-8W]|uniref:Protein kinase domain-containing protein n=1 Tax=Marinobacter nanhaiticus D15-8W TaxID=626887 RepID=N6X018_9GAMM|nr:Mn2+-dependent serine/threonine protein kinase [Marinobacter nanhaiticus]ENO16777.1 hypothetical protein J057_03695 [Marinobacter nanhaiticus D15-8W]BES72592.1 hypothetical protein RE428_36100 [Marinobacter nanhaiticus D15-8W]
MLSHPDCSCLADAPLKRLSLQTGEGFLKADVFIALHDGKPVICKDYQKFRGSWLSWPAQFLVRREARMLEYLSDWPHSPRLIGVMGKLVLMLEYVPGELLSEYMGSGSPLCFSQLVAAMQSLHKLSITHNDVRGNNIILGQDRVVLIDFAGALRGRGPGRFLLSPLRRADMAHLLKYKRRLAGEEATEEEKRRYRKASWIGMLQRLWKKRLLPHLKRRPSESGDSVSRP